MSSHRIRLAGPWEWQALTESSGAAATGEVQKCQLPFPSEPDVTAEHGIVLLRRFHCPTGIGVNTAVAVAVDLQNCVAEVRLNGQILTGVDGSVPIEGANSGLPNEWRCDISGFLKPFNELQVRLIPPGSGPPSEFRLNAAALEIRESK